MGERGRCPRHGEEQATPGGPQRSSIYASSASVYTVPAWSVSATIDCAGDLSRQRGLEFMQARTRQSLQRDAPPAAILQRRPAICQASANRSCSREETVERKKKLVKETQSRVSGRLYAHDAVLALSSRAGSTDPARTTPSSRTSTETCALADALRKPTLPGCSCECRCARQPCFWLRGMG